MITQNINALKASDNLKWDFELGYTAAMKAFRYSGQPTDEFKGVAQDVVNHMQDIITEANLLMTEAQKYLS